MARKSLGLLLALLLSLAATAYAATPTEMAFQGLLSDAAGAPLSGVHQLTFTLYGSEAGTDSVWTNTQSVAVVQGAFSTILGGAANPLDGKVFTGGALWLGVKVDDGAELSPRSPIGAVPYATRASLADDATGDIHPRSVTIDGNKIIDESGKWVGDMAGMQGLKGDKGEQARTFDVVDDRATRHARQHVGGNEHELAIRENDFAILGDNAEAVAVAVEGDADFSVGFLEGLDHVGQVFRLRRVRVMIREIAIDFAEQRHDLATQTLEEFRGDCAGDAVATIHDDLHRAGQRAVERRRQCLRRA